MNINLGRLKPIYLFILLYILVATVGGGLIFNVKAVDNSDTVVDTDFKKIEIFVQTGCPHCRKVEEFIQDKHIDVTITNIMVDKDAASRLLDLCHKYDINQCGTPAMFDSSVNILTIGDKQIIEYLDGKINRSDTEQAPEHVVSSTNNFSTLTSNFKPVTLLTVIVAALLDSVNPCAWTALVFLLTSLIALDIKKKKAFIIGIAYISVIYVMYLLMGLGIIKLFDWLTAIIKYIYMFIGIILILGGLIEVKDYFFKGVGFSLKIPEKTWPIIRKYMRKVTIWASLVAGFIVSIVEFGCTGGVYLSILSMLSKDTLKSRAFVLLVIYNIIFVTPLLVILTTVLLGKAKSKNIKDLVNKKEGGIRLITGVFMIMIGIWVLYKYV